MKAPSGDMMNSLSREILNLYSYDDKAGRYDHLERAETVPEPDQPVSDAGGLQLSCI